jgi:hypothetical protein
MCPERERLKVAYAEASMTVAVISARMNVSGAAGAGCVSELEDAILASNKAHFELNWHIGQHRCGESEGPVPSPALGNL